MLLLRQIANEVMLEDAGQQASSPWTLKRASRFDKMDHEDAAFVVMRGSQIAGYVEEPVEVGSGHRAKLVMNGGKTFNVDWSVGSAMDNEMNLKIISKALDYRKR